MTNLLGEFLGTMVLIIFGSGVVANVLLKKSKAEGAGWGVIILGWGVGVVMGVFMAIAAGAPQADINPAVTLAKTMLGVYTAPHAIVTMVAQLAGGFTGGVIVWLAFLPHWEISEDKGAKLAVFCTGPAIRNYPANILCEIIGTMVLILSIFAMFSKPVGGLAPGFGPFLVGFLVWGIGASLGGPTGYAINPARDLGPRLAHFVCPIAGKGGSDWAYSWVPVVAPLIGAVLSYLVGKSIGLI
jgi:glycerol uptake facilitator protein